MTITKLFYQSKSLLLTFTTAFLLLFTACGNDGGGVDNGELNPEITSISPESGPPGASVTISGSDFSPTASENTVTFAGTEAEVTEAGESKLLTTVPDNAESGEVQVTVDGNTASGPNFTVEAEAPGISSVEPDSGTTGTKVTITGMNFSATAEENIITFGGTEATVTSASETELVTKVPEGAESGPVKVTVNGKTTTGPEFTMVANAPKISSVEPNNGSVGTEITITGSNFSATPEENIITFGGTEATVTSASETELMTEVPQNANSGPVEVTVKGATATGPDFKVTVENIAQAIDSESKLNSLSDLLQNTDLRATLEDNGSYTILAPTDAAFSSFEEGFLDNLSQQQLEEVLSYHVIEGDRALSDLEASREVKTLQGGSVYLIGNGTINNKPSIVSSPDIDAPNGQIHKIDRPLLPDAYLDVFDITYKRPVTNKFACHCISDRTNLDEVLHDENSEFTVFAPSVAAFNNREVPVDSLSDSELQNLMNYHIVENQVLRSGDLNDGQTLTARNGETITVSVAADGDIMLNNSAIIQTVDLVGTNGVIHVIDTVLEVPSGDS